MIVSIFLILSLWPALGWTKENYISKPQYRSTSDGSYRNQLEVAEWVLHDTNNQEYGYFVYTTGILTYNMDYLLWYLSKTNNIGDPSNQKHQTTYLILYPHSVNDEGAHDFWKKNVVRTNGKIINKKHFESNIAVEKLLLAPNEPQPDPNYYQNLLFR